MVLGGIKSLVDADMAPISVPMLIVFAINKSPISGKTTFLEYFSFMTAAKPLPVTSPILAHIS